MRLQKLASIGILSLLFGSILMIGSASASFSGGHQSVIIVFKDAVSPGDVQYLKGLGGAVSFTYTIIDGIAADLPIAAVEKLKAAQSSGSDPVAGRIKYIEDDGVMHTLGKDGQPQAAAAARASAM